MSTKLITKYNTNNAPNVSMNLMDAKKVFVIKKAIVDNKGDFNFTTRTGENLSLSKYNTKTALNTLKKLGADENTLKVAFEHIRKNHPDNPKLHAVMKTDNQLRGAAAARKVQDTSSVAKNKVVENLSNPKEILAALKEKAPTQAQVQTLVNKQVDSAKQAWHTVKPKTGINGVTASQLKTAGIMDLKLEAMHTYELAQIAALLFLADGEGLQPINKSYHSFNENQFLSATDSQNRLNLEIAMLNDMLAQANRY